MISTHLADCTACGRAITLTPGLDKRHGMTRQEAKFLFVSAEGECRDCQMRRYNKERDDHLMREKAEAKARHDSRVIATITFADYSAFFYKTWVNRPQPAEMPS